MRCIKKFAKRVLRHLGYDLIPYSKNRNFADACACALLQHRVDLVLDVGANAGQFASGLRSAGYAETIISFEPMSVEHKQLVNLASGDSKWQVAPRMAIGDSNCTGEINIAANSGSSSLLPMLDLHREAAPESAYAGKEPIQIRRLDTVARELFDSNFKNIFLKIDVQGYEWSVLEGAKETMGRVVGVLCECSFSPLYGGEARWNSLVDKIEAMGFEIWGVSPGFADPRTGRLLQADFLFFRKR